IRVVDLIKIAIVVAGFALLYVIGRLLSSAIERRDGSLVLSVQRAYAAPVDDDSDWINKNLPAAVGSEIEFHIAPPPVFQQPDGTYNRPEFTNYFFLKTDLLQGPADRDCLYDELRIEARDPGNNCSLIYRYTVATLAGLRQFMENNNLSSLYLDEFPVVIVERWDLRSILETVFGEIIKGYGGEQLEAIEEEKLESNKSDK